MIECSRVGLWATCQRLPELILVIHAAIHTPACLWRRTGEIYKANKEFSVLTGIPSALLRGGKIGIYELMTEESMVQYYQVRIKKYCSRF
jgi:hypothetical protein